MNAPCPPTGSGYASGARTTPAAVEPATPAPGDTGAIQGAVNYPSSQILPQLVYALDTRGASYGAYSVETTWDQAAYTMLGVKPGTYFVFSTLRPVRLNPNCWSVWGAGYTNAVTCGLQFGCDDHRPIEVAVRAGQTTSGINVWDWYASPTFGNPPAPPPSAVPDALWSTPTYASFPTAGQAFADYLPGRFEAYLAGASRSSCPMNRACLTIPAPQTGSAAAYVTPQVGSNLDVLTCVFLAYQDSAGWHAFARQRCRPGVAFPAVGSTGLVLLGMGSTPSDCLRVHMQPGLSASVVGCVRNGTTVLVDAGPAYIAPSPGQDPQNGFWWHLQGRGWVNDEFLGGTGGP